MSNVKLLLSALMGISLVFLGVSAFGQDWPQWRGADRDGKVALAATPATWPKELKQEWTLNVGTGDATPALVGDRVYVFTRQGEEEVTLCLDAATGTEVWQHRYAASAVEGPASRHPGPRSSPAVAEGKVVILGVNGVLICLDAANGTELWRNEAFSGVTPKFSTAMSPLVTDGLCVAHLGSESNGAIVACDLATGAAKWQWTGDGPTYASPVLLTLDGVKQVVQQTAKSVVGVSLSDGKPLWQIPSEAQGRFYNSATPIVTGSTVIYTGQGQGTKAITIEKQGDEFVAREIWSNAELGTGFNTPVLRDGLLFGISDKGSFYCMNAETGATAWIDTATRRDNFGSVLDGGSLVLGLNPGSELVAFKPDASAYAEVGRIKVAETPVYAHPVVVGNRIFVKDEDTLTLWML